MTLGATIIGSTQMTEELKPCPFCGGEAALIIPSELVEADCADIYVSCEECEAESQHVVVEMRDRTPDLWPYERRDAIAAWNTRLSHSAEKEALIATRSVNYQLQLGMTELVSKNDAGIAFVEAYIAAWEAGTGTVYLIDRARSTLLLMRNNGNG